MLEAVLTRLHSLHPKTIDLSLDRMRRFLDDLGRPQDRLPPVVHIAGTNGKGSTLATLRAIAEAAGLSVHVYTSPHLVRFAERIRVAGKLIDDERLRELLERCEAVNAGRPITFFEITTAAAFLAFAETKADLCLLETGMGGRLDATNLVERPALTLLSSISMDHEAYLGSTLAAIAGEKAGILKPDTPCLTVRQKPDAMTVITARARALHAPLITEGTDWTAEAGPTDDMSMIFAAGATQIALPRPSLIGPHQIGNAGLALACAHRLAANGVLPPALVGEETLRHALPAIDWPGRLQKLTQGPLPALLPPGTELWLDGGHNPDAGRMLAEMAGTIWSGRPLDLVVGMLTTKDTQAFLAPLRPYVRRVRTVAIPAEILSRSAIETASIAKAAGFSDCREAADIEAAIAELAGDPGDSERILICGSLYLAGTVLAANA